MMRSFLELMGVLGPRMDGLEELVDDIAAGRLPADEAVTRIRSLAQQPRERWARRMIVLLPLFGGAMFLLVGIAIGVVNYLSVANAIPATGMVTHLIGGRTQFEYVVDGVTHAGRSWIQSDPPDHSVGDQIRVLYRPENPSTARIDSFVELWLFPTVFPIVGLFSMMGGAAAYSVLRRYR